MLVTSRWCRAEEEGGEDEIGVWLIAREDVEASGDIWPCADLEEKESGDGCLGTGNNGGESDMIDRGEIV